MSRSIICRPNSCNTSYIVPCSKVEQCINKNLHEIMDGNDSGIPDFCATTTYCTTNYLTGLDNYSSTGVRYLTITNGEFIWESSTSAYTDEQAQDAVGGIFSTEFIYNDSIPSISIQQVDWTKIINYPPFLLSVDIDSTDITVTGSPATGSAVPSPIVLTLPNINANVGTFNSVTVNAKGQVTAASNLSAGLSVAQSIQSGTGIVTTFNIAHGLGGIAKAVVIAASQDASGISYITTDTTNIVINYNVAPPSGTNNLIFNWIANL